MPACRTRRERDSLDRLIEQTDPLAGLTRYAYDAMGNLLSVTNPLNQIIERRTYDARGRLSERQDAKLAKETFAYDGNGNVTSSTDRRGRITTYAFDAADRLVQIADADGRTTRYDYDLAGNVSRISDSASGDLLIQYDALSRPVQVTTDQGTVGYDYDALGRRTKMTVNGGDEVAYGYDKASRITAIAFRGKTAAFQYDAAGRLTNKTLPNGMTQAFDYDAASRLLSIQFRKSDGTPIEQIQYAYDANGNRTEKRLGGDSLRETGFDAQYDEANRLTRLTLNPGAAGENTYELLYDAAGNLTSRTNLADATDRTSYAWDAKGRLTTLAGPGYAASFQYDALGRRIGKTVNGNSVGYLYDGMQAIAELNGNAISAAYHPGIQIDEVLARHTSQGQRTLLQDALNNVVAQAKEDQAFQNWYAYSPYGESQALGDGGGNPLQYTGRENDGTGLYYYRARYYDPVLKRFISEDPIGLAGGLNTFSYVDGDPSSGGDPMGLTTVYRGPGNSFSQFPPPGASCAKAVWRGGYIMGREPCYTPSSGPGAACPGGAGTGAGPSGSGQQGSGSSSDGGNGSDGGVGAMPGRTIWVLGPQPKSMIPRPAIFDDLNRIHEKIISGLRGTGNAIAGAPADAARGATGIIYSINPPQPYHPPTGGVGPRN